MHLPPKEAIMLNFTYCKLSALQRILPFSLLSKWKWSMFNCFFSLSVLNNKLWVEWKKKSFQQLLRRIFGFYSLTYSTKLFFWADLKVPVCHVMYASTLWSTSDNNSWELFTLFWNASKRCQSFLCFRVPVCSAGSWVLDDRSSVLGVSFFKPEPCSETSKLPKTDPWTPSTCALLVNILQHTLNTSPLQGAFYAQWKAIVWGSLRDTLFNKQEREKQPAYTVSSMVFTGFCASRPS